MPMFPSQWTYTKVTKRKKRYKRPGQTLCNNIIIWQTDDHEGFQCMCLAVMPKQGGKASDSQDRKLNSTHLRLLCKGASQQLTITNTIFCLANERKILWMHSRSEQWLLADNQNCLWVDLKLCNWTHSKFLGTTVQRSHSKHPLNIKMETCPGGSLQQWS